MAQPTTPSPEITIETQGASAPQTDASARAKAQQDTPETRVPAVAQAPKEDPDLPGDATPGHPPPPIGKTPNVTRQYELVEFVRSYDPDLDEDLLNRAYVFAMKAHGGQMRQSGDPYFSHPVAVAAILADLKLDPVTIATALLHDVVEDTDVTVQDIAELFGDEVAQLVDGVTKISTKELPADVDGKAENFGKFILATCKDVRVLLVKLADRLHNMRTLHHTKPEKQQRIALETMEIYAPLARIIGIERFREELEDLSFYYLRPDDYAAITAGLKQVTERSVSDVIALSQTLRSEIEKAGIEAEIYSREKRAFSIWRKMQRKKQLFEELADIYAFRVIVPTEDDCYRALGVIHQNYRMIPGEFDDYISTPKPNNYRSIHTAVLLSKDKKGQKAEIQIRTKEMHEAAERGIAAHWKYKDASTRAQGKTVELKGSENYNDYEWLRQTVSSLESGGSASELLQTAKLEFYRDQIFCFTPRGRVIGLPVGASPIDFAYALHTDIGDTYSGAKVNGILRPNRHQLKNGDVVEILRTKDAPIPQGWESFAVTGSAKLRLRRRTKDLALKEQHALGERIIRNTFNVHDVPYSPDAVREAAKRMGFRGLKPLLEAVGRLEVADTAVLDEVYPNLRAGQKAQRRPIEPGKDVGKQTISIEGLSKGAALAFCQSCRPLPGERIIGVKGEGGRIRVHRIDCQLLAEQDDSDWLDLSWRNDPDAAFVVEVVVTVTNRTGAIGHIGSLLAKYEADIHDLRVENREVQFSDLRVEFAVRDARHLANVMTALRGSDFVVSAERSEGVK
ncbi:RelA/SpoT family protein [Parvularcula lutaonensis]|uniref:GTP pyrophosphokinase rsh n=1 Tax=Parvularcula lutaonensis TaxID=491923 RepID=A0ABV7MD82_9PROT|nr:bifunctional (p)ppGpp synthetase/guanosine-3',5'-bis(diphosphate) 3'-pyrophosphohydrolase [Parvularcula lutaonensis]GGY52589.1 guanosine-3',5'-bis(diphosphate) 3'-pyrophosphohydrolase [Parvularcula lutaonensis]